MTEPSLAPLGGGCTKTASFDELYRREQPELVRLAVAARRARPRWPPISCRTASCACTRSGKVEDHRAYLRRSVVNACHSHHRGLRRFRRLDLRPSEPVELGARELSDALAALPHRRARRARPPLLRRAARRRHRRRARLPARHGRVARPPRARRPQRGDRTMTDDLEPRLTDHLHQRASRVSTPPDVADVHHRIDAAPATASTACSARHWRIALVAGPLAAWRRRSPPSPTSTPSPSRAEAAPPTAGDNSHGRRRADPRGRRASATSTRRWSSQSTGPRPRGSAWSSTPPPRPGERRRVVDGVVRVGVVDDDLIDVALMETAPADASFGIAGTADARPMWVVVAPGYETVEATFPNGAADDDRGDGGLAVLAAYADAGQRRRRWSTTSSRSTACPVVDMETARRHARRRHRRLRRGRPAGRQPPSTVMPEPGEPPADEEAARAEITDAVQRSSTASRAARGRAPRERPSVWLDARQRFREEQPELRRVVQEVYGDVHEIVFTAPDRASRPLTRSSPTTPSIPAPGERIGEAVLIDGHVEGVDRDELRRLCALAGIECDYSIEG